MAKKEETSKIILERTYNIPLRKETLKVPPFRKANKAVKAVKEFISKHMKSDNVVIGKYLNLRIWKHGARNPPHHIKVNVSKDDKNRVFAEFADAPKEQVKVEKKVKEVKEDIKSAKAEEKQKHEENHEKEIEEIREEKAEEAKKIEKEEIRELKQEHSKHHPQKVPPKQRLQDMHPPAPKSL